MDYPKFVKIGEKKYCINTDFRIAIECNQIAQDKEIGDYERALAIIYKLYGEDGLNDFSNHDQLIKLAKKYLLANKEFDSNNSNEPDMDFVQDMDYIKASFMSDYNINLDEREMHWWEFSNLIDGLSNSELGNCCVLNRIRNLRTYDVSQIKDRKEREKLIKAKERVALKKTQKENNLTKEQEESMRRFNEKVLRGE